MWPNSKGKGGKGGSSKKDGSEGGKPRATRTKMKAMQAPDDAEPKSEAELESDIFDAAHKQAQEQAAQEEEAIRSTTGSFLKLPDKPGSNMDEQLSGVWKSRLMGGQKGPVPSQAQAAPMPTKAAQEAAEKARAGFQHEAMLNVVDRMFDQFQGLAYEFNQVARGSDLELTWIRPSVSRENFGSWHQGVQFINVFSGRISTRYWTLVVRGTFEAVLAFVIPSDKLLTFSSDPGHYQPVLELLPIFDGISVTWHIGNRPIGPAELDQAYRSTLDCLVQVAQEDRAPIRPIDIFAEDNVEDQASQGQVHQSAPGADFSAFGDELDYSQRYKQHLSGSQQPINESQAPQQFGQQPFQHSGQNAPPQSERGNSGFASGSGTDSGSSNPFISSASHPQLPSHAKSNPFLQGPAPGSASGSGAEPGGASSQGASDWKAMGSSSSFSTRSKPQGDDEFKSFNSQSQSGSFPQSQSGSFPQSQSGSFPQSQSGSFPQSQSGSFPQSQSGSFPQSQSGSFSQGISSFSSSSSSSGSGASGNTGPQAAPRRDDDGWRSVPGQPPIPGVKGQSQSGGNPFISQANERQSPHSTGHSLPQSSSAGQKDDNWNFMPLDKAQNKTSSSLTPGAAPADQGSANMQNIAAQSTTGGWPKQSPAFTQAPAGNVGNLPDWPRRQTGEFKSEPVASEGSSGNIRLDRLAFDIANQAQDISGSEFNSFTSAVAARFPNAQSQPPVQPNQAAQPTPPFAQPNEMPQPQAPQTGQNWPSGFGSSLGQAPAGWPNHAPVPPFVQPQSPASGASSSSGSSTQPPFPFAQWPQRFGQKPTQINPEDIAADELLSSQPEAAPEDLVQAAQPAAGAARAKDPFIEEDMFGFEEAGSGNVVETCQELDAVSDPAAVVARAQTAEKESEVETAREREQEPTSEEAEREEETASTATDGDIEESVKELQFEQEPSNKTADTPKEMPEPDSEKSEDSEESALAENSDEILESEPESDSESSGEYESAEQVDDVEAAEDASFADEGAQPTELEEVEVSLEQEDSVELEESLEQEEIEEPSVAEESVEESAEGSTEPVNQEQEPQDLEQDLDDITEAHQSSPHEKDGEVEQSDDDADEDKPEPQGKDDDLGIQSLAKAVDGSMNSLQDRLFGENPGVNVAASMGSLSPLSSSPQMVSQAGHSIKSEIERLIQAFDIELELISAKGSDAFAKRDLKGAETMIKLAETINEYKENLLKLKSEYDSDLT